MSNNNSPSDKTNVACDRKLSRKEFLADVLKKAAIAGTIVAAPKVLDKFLVPPVYARNSTIQFSDTTNAVHDNHSGGGGNTSPFHDGGGSGSITGFRADKKNGGDGGSDDSGFSE